MPRKNKVSNAEYVGTPAQKAFSTARWHERYKSVPRRHLEFGNVIGVVERFIAEKRKQLGKPIPDGVSAVAFDNVMTLHAIGTRNNDKDVESMKCPKCQKVHKITCTECGESYAIKMLDTTAENNSVKALQALSNKMFPNKAAITQDINITNVTTVYTEEYVKLVHQYVPKKDREKVLVGFQKTMESVVDD